MGAIPGNIDADRAPPMTIPLRHFVVGLGFLLSALLVGAAGSLEWAIGTSGLSYIHLLLAGWICVTIMGAMTQFVPVWSGVAIHSKRLATAQLWLVTAGLVGFVAALLSGAFEWLAIGAVVMLSGFWIFAYNVGRTLSSARPWDVTERHFALGLGFFVLLTALGVPLAIGVTREPFSGLPIGHENVRVAHATLAVFGAVLTTIFGALYQLATMFTQTELDRIDEGIQRFETISYPIGVICLAGGRFVGIVSVARVGGTIVALCVLGVGVILLRKLYETRVARTPMVHRYAVVAVAMVLWALLALPAWIVDPLAADRLYGASGTVHLLAFGIIGFVVVGTLYHVVPFIVWVHRYSDLLGLSDVPMIDDLYDDRLARVDFVSIFAGTVGLVAGDLLSAPAAVRSLSAGVLLFGASVFVANMLLVVYRHSPHGLVGVLCDRFVSESGDETSTMPADRT